MKSHLVQLRKSFAGKAVNFEFGPDDPQYKILKEFQNDQLAQLYDMAPPGQEHHGPASRGQPSETYSHSYRVANDVYMFAAYIGLSEQIARNLRWCVLLHDIGKMDVPTEIFHKPGRLTPEEFIEIKRHTQYGADRIRKSGISHPIIELATEIALYHHERPDGHGYYGLSDKKVPSRIRLVQLCDIYDALSAPRMYRRADEELSIYNAMKNILDPHGWKFKEVDQMFARPFCLLKLNLLEADLSKEDHKMLEEYLIHPENYTEDDYVPPSDFVHLVD